MLAAGFRTASGWGETTRVTLTPQKDTEYPPPPSETGTCDRRYSFPASELLYKAPLLSTLCCVRSHS